MGRALSRCPFRLVGRSEFYSTGQRSGTFAVRRTFFGGMAGRNEPMANGTAGNDGTSPATAANSTNGDRRLSRMFADIAQVTSREAGRAWVFALAVATIAVWAVTGPLFGFSDTWQLVINTGTTIITFLMVFLIQNTQNRDAEAIQVKLDELIRLSKGGHNVLLDLEELEDDELNRIRQSYCQIAEE